MKIKFKFFLPFLYIVIFTIAQFLPLERKCDPNVLTECKKPILQPQSITRITKLSPNASPREFVMFNLNFFPKQIGTVAPATDWVVKVFLSFISYIILGWLIDLILFKKSKSAVNQNTKL